MANVLLLKISGLGLEGKIAISNSVQMGRSTQERWHRWAVQDREQPPEFAGLEAFLPIDGMNVSRNHAAITQREGEYFLVDLNSLNGTYLNGQDVNPHRRNPQPFLLREGDCISLNGEKINLDVKFTQFMNYALLVAGSGDHPTSPDNNIELIGQELTKRGYVVQTLTGEQATKQAVRDSIRELSNLTVPESHFFFSYYGHGNTLGIKLNGQIMNPRELYKELQKVRAQTAVIIEACHSGIFVNAENADRIPEGVLVLTASAADRGAVETRLLQDEPEYVGRFTKALVEYLRTNREEFNLKEFYRSMHDNTHHTLLLQEPGMHGTTYTIPRATSMLNLKY